MIFWNQIIIIFVVWVLIFQIIPLDIKYFDNGHWNGAIINFLDERKEKVYFDFSKCGIILNSATDETLKINLISILAIHHYFLKRNPISKYLFNLPFNVNGPTFIFYLLSNDECNFKSVLNSFYMNDCNHAP